MLANLLKSLTHKTQVRYTFELTRQFCSRTLENENKDNIPAGSKRRAAKNEEEDALKIEASLFEQSSIKYEPVTAEEVLRKNKKIPKPANKPKVPSFIKKTRQERESQSRIIDDLELGLQYIKLDQKDPRLATLMTTARSKKRRDKDGQIVIEGRRLILEALECGLKLKAVIFSQKDQLAEIKDQVAAALKLHPHSQIYKVPHHDLKTWSTLTTPPGVMTLFERPSLKYIEENSIVTPLPLTVVCDNIREPNNLGSIIRTCAALPCFQVVVTKGCCDPWDSKALRGGCGGHFRVPILDDVAWENVPLTIPAELANDCCVFIAENNCQKLENANAQVIEYSQIDRTIIGSHNVVVIGGESHGVSKESYRFMSTVGSRGKCLYIPLAEGFDSLNVASALTLILYELRKTILKAKEEIQISLE